MPHQENFVDVWYGDYSGANAGQSGDPSRQVLAKYLDTSPSRVQVQIGKHGKPFIAGGGLHFNLSHTGKLWVLAVSDIYPLGIDAEALNTNSHAKVAKKYFAASELQFYQAQPPAARPRLFYQLWTCKEAFAKAAGRGIAIGLKQCVVDCRTLQNFTSLPPGYGTPNDWKIAAIPINTNTICTLILNTTNFNHYNGLSINTIPILGGRL